MTGKQTDPDRPVKLFCLMFHKPLDAFRWAKESPPVVKLWQTTFMTATANGRFKISETFKASSEEDPRINPSVAV